MIFDFFNKKKNVDTDKIMEFLDTKWKSVTCICGSTTLNFMDDIIIELPVRGDKECMPIIPVICINCGYTHFVSYGYIKNLMEKENAL